MEVVRVGSGLGRVGRIKPLIQCHPVDRVLLCDYVLIRDQEADFLTLFLLNFWSVSSPGARAPHTRTHAPVRAGHVRILPVFPPTFFFFSPPVVF